MGIYEDARAARDDRDRRTEADREAALAREIQQKREDAEFAEFIDTFLHAAAEANFPAVAIGYVTAETYRKGLFSSAELAWRFRIIGRGWARQVVTDYGDGPFYKSGFLLKDGRALTGTHPIVANWTALKHIAPYSPRRYGRQAGREVEPRISKAPLLSAPAGDYVVYEPPISEPASASSAYTTTPPSLVRRSDYASFRNMFLDVLGDIIG